MTTSTTLLASQRFRTGLLLGPLLVGVALRPLVAPTDPDYWWHVRTGQLIYETGHLPPGDPFSFTVPGNPWVTHEWLTELALYAVASRFGYLGNVVAFGLIIAATWLLVYLTTRRWGVGQLPAMILTMLGALATVVHQNVRPQMLTVLLLALCMLVVTHHRQGRARAIWLVPPIMALWVNLHGGYVIGLALVELVLAVELAAGFLGRSKTPRRTLLAVMALTTGATLLNPHGVAALLYPFTYAGTSNASMRFVLEWQSPDFHLPVLLPFLAVLLLALAVGITRQPLGLAGTLALLLLAFQSLQSVRHIPLFVVVAIPLLGARLRTEIPALGRTLEAWRRPRLLVVIGAALLVSVVASVLLPDRSGGLQLGWEPSSATYPRDAVAYLRAHDVPDRLLNEYGWGGYLIHELYPKRRVFIDGRADVYGDELVEQAVKVTNLGEGWRQTLDDYQIDAVLVGKTSALAEALALDGSWREVLDGKVERLFIREGR